MLRRRTAVAAAALVLLALAGPPAAAHDPQSPEGQAEQSELLRLYEPAWRSGARLAGAPQTCVNGLVDKYPCKNVDLLSFLPQSELGGGGSSSMWHWTDTGDGAEYILYCRSNGLSFVDVSDPVNPRYLGNLPSTKGLSSTWCDVRTHQHYAYIGKDGVDHGIQVFDLTKLRGVTSTQTFTADATYTGLTFSHTLWINQGFLYVSGANTCKKGITLLDITAPLSPRQVACYDREAYSHEAIALNYTGPDTRYTGREILLNFTGKAFQILDVTDKAAITVLSSVTHPGAEFVHQGFPTSDLKHVIVNDEYTSNAGGSPDFVYNIEKLDAARYVGKDISTRGEFINHNGYTVGDRHYQAAYRGGLRILDTTNAGTASLPEVGFFDTEPTVDDSRFSGTWMVLPFLKNGVAAVQSMGGGLYLVRPTGAAAR